MSLTDTIKNYREQKPTQLDPDVAFTELFPTLHDFRHTWQDVRDAEIRQESGTSTDDVEDPANTPDA